MSNEKNIATLSIVRNMTNSCLRKFGMNRTSFRIRNSRNVRKTLNPELPSLTPKNCWPNSNTLCVGNGVFHGGVCVCVSCSESESETDFTVCIHSVFPITHRDDDEKRWRNQRQMNIHMKTAATTKTAKRKRKERNWTDEKYGKTWIVRKY